MKLRLKFLEEKINQLQFLFKYTCVMIFMLFALKYNSIHYVIHF